MIGLGYAGLPLAVAFGMHCLVIGFDTDEARIRALKGGFDKNGNFSKAELEASSIGFTSSSDDLAACDFYIIVVPTPVDAAKQPNLEYLIGATKIVGPYLKRGDIVVYESTVYPGATEEVCVPILESESKLRSPSDFAVGYSPERISCGDASLSLHNTVKIVAAQNAETVKTVGQVYSMVVDAGLFEAGSIRIAEAAKLVENIQRDVNIALMNEFAMIFDSLNISTSEVLQAAGTKHNFVNFVPGLVGGHCISIDPYYLIHKASGAAELLACSRSINDGMPKFIVERTVEQMREHGLFTAGCRVGVLGLTFKENFCDIRESRCPDIVDELERAGVRTLVHDPLAMPEDARAQYKIELVEWSGLRDLSAVIVCVAHEGFRKLGVENFREILVADGLVVDVKALYDPGIFAGSGLHLWQL